MRIKLALTNETKINQPTNVIFVNIFMDRVQFERLLLKPSYSD